MDVLVLGCGYVGLELGTQLEAAGHDVAGIRRSESGLDEIRAAGFGAIKGDITDGDLLASVPDADAVVFLASSDGRGADGTRELYVDGVRLAIREFGKRETSPDQFIFTSSTGVYGDHDGGWVDEETTLGPTTEKTRILTEAEHVVFDESETYGMDSTVVRFAGLYGPGRYRLERYIDGPVTEGYLNMIHRDDAAGVIRFALTDATEDVLLAVDDEPVSKWEFANWLAAECSVDPPAKRTIEDRLTGENRSTSAQRRLRSSKRCSNSLLCKLGYEYSFPTFREGYQDAIATYCRGENGG